MKLDPAKFRYGIEHEFPCIDKEGRFVDFSTATFDDLNKIIADLPIYESDYPRLRVGDLGIKKKRWYIEGFERFSDQGVFDHLDIKGFEIRTPICSSIEQTVAVLEKDYSLWKDTAARHGYRPAAISFNPFKTEFVLEPPLNQWEKNYLESIEEPQSYIHMLTYGPDISISHPDIISEQMIDIARKLIHYSPYILPFSFSSPFYDNDAWGGLSYRTLYRTSIRPAVRIFLADDAHMIKATPPFTEVARIPAEIGRIEYKAFDMIYDMELYPSLVALIQGIILDDTLTGRSDTPDIALHELSAREGFTNEVIFSVANQILNVARKSLSTDEFEFIDALQKMLAERRSPANDMIDRYKQGESIRAIINNSIK